MEFFAFINWLAVLVATALGFGLGALWYSNALFGKAWVSEMGKPMEQLGKPAEAMAITFVGTFLGAVALAWFVQVIPLAGWLPGLKLGVFCGTAFAAATQVSDGAYQGRSWRARLIDGGYRVVMFAIMGAVLGVWR